VAIRNRELWDKLGACASAVCAVHCVLTGVALSLLSALGLGFFGSPAVDGFFLTVAVLVGGIALWHGKRRHHSYVPGAFYVLGLVLLLVAHIDDFTGHAGHNHGPLSTILSVAGGVSFVVFHILNLRMQRVHERGECSCQRRSISPN